MKQFSLTVKTFIKKYRVALFVFLLFSLLWVSTAEYRKDPELIQTIPVGKIESIELLEQDALLWSVPYYKIKTSNGNQIIYYDIWEVENIGVYHVIGSESAIEVYNNPGTDNFIGYFVSAGTKHKFCLGVYDLG